MTQMAYIVTQGNYSDYHIRRVYLVKAEAEAYVELLNKKHGGSAYLDAQVEEYPIGEDGYYRGKIWRAVYDKGKKPAYKDIWSYNYDDVAVSSAQIEHMSDTAITIIGTSREHVEKALSDAITQLKARQAGIT